MLLSRTETEMSFWRHFDHCCTKLAEMELLLSCAEPLRHMEACLTLQ